MNDRAFVVRIAVQAMGIGEQTLSALWAFRPQMKQMTAGLSVNLAISSLLSSWLDRTHKCPSCFSGLVQQPWHESLIGRFPLCHRCATTR
jgi:hypothetical protein